ncbi:MAG TPA: hypothetical protein VGN47_02415 [Blastococcus sp.]|jgi:hypothetical protein|nr:hypothetical protein [Blastococcus sp.]
MVVRVGPSSRAGAPGPVRSAGPTEAQLGQLLARLLADANGDPAHERAVREHLAASCQRYATARVREFLLILIERDVRRRLSGA